MTDDLGGSDRTVVRRIRLPDGGSAVHKAYVTAGEGFVRESAALSVVGTPGLLAEVSEPPSITMVDLGGGPDVAALLLAADPDAATRAVLAWATAMADLAVATATRRAEFVTALDARAGDQVVAAETMAESMSTAVAVLGRYAAELGVEPPPPIALPTGPSALTPGDCCPDNALLVGESVVLIDYEDAQWRPVAWDAAYLTVPWPTCWCSWRLPAAVSAQAVETYRERLAPHLPAVAGDAFDRDLTAARDGWALWSAAHLLPRALGNDPAEGPRPTPTRRASVLHRLADAADRSAFAAALHAALASRWGSQPLALAPAFR